MQLPIVIHNTSNMPLYFWHPSVVYNPEGFGGHKWWMAQSPYHPAVELRPYRARWELPCIHYSDDGIIWKSIAMNPIDDLSEEQLLEQDYLSDPHLIYKDGMLELYYRLTLLRDKQLIGNKTLLFKKLSTDGVNWSERVVVADLRKNEDIEVWGEQIISQTIVWTGKEYICWYVDGSGYKKDRGIKVAISKDGVSWQKAKQCILKDYQDTPWHIDVQQYDNMYHMLCYGDSQGVLTHLTSEDGEIWRYAGDILEPSHNWKDFYSERLYRACSIRVNDMFYVYFSAASKHRSYIGLLQTSDWQNIKMCGPQINIHYTLDYLYMLYNKIVNKCRKILKI